MEFDTFHVLNIDVYLGYCCYPVTRSWSVRLIANNEPEKALNILKALNRLYHLTQFQPLLRLACDLSLFFRFQVVKGFP